jgi:hypothetical protein
MGNIAIHIQAVVSSNLGLETYNPGLPAVYFRTERKKQTNKQMPVWNFLSAP